MRISGAVVLLFCAHLVRAVPGKFTSFSLHPGLNVTASIPYDSILQNYVQQKIDGNAKCSKLRHRVEWRALTAKQRQDWINAHWCLTQNPSLLAGAQTNLTGFRTSLHDDFSLIHLRLFHTIHYVAAFLPWHRYFIMAREAALRHCHYEGPLPYWDWGNILASPILSDDLGVGGNGTAPNGTVITGPFSHLPSSYINLPNANESDVTFQPHYLTRTFGTAINRNATYPMFEESYNSSAMRRVMTDSGDDYTLFEPLFEGIRGRQDIVGTGPHAGVHRSIGGEMNNAHSPNDPVFFLHHANVDRLWHYWQNGDTTGRGIGLSRSNWMDLNSKFWAYAGNTKQRHIQPDGGPNATLFDVQTVEGLFLPNVETYKIMDIERPPLCYTYV
ncbi:hypothetical protein OC846_005795 [Tilletia horrida]|uniref:Tyrosinase copper-binding domain-containing protein n=1 Tax=Tilletia horrida TaxID=155126 RepID=A0AAN6JPK3_9BASI|nr:hypothetical protein OC846_005795 [Tilletia horrida]